MLNIFVEKYDNLSDNELITKIRENDQAAFEALFSRYLPRIKHIISKDCYAALERDDVFQDATISFYYATQMFDFSSSSFSTFLSICIERSLNSTIKKASALKRIPNNMLVYVDGPIDDSVRVISAEEEFFTNNSSVVTENINLSRLSKFELAVLKSFLKNGSYDITAEELSVDKKAVDNALVRVRKKLNS